MAEAVGNDLDGEAPDIAKGFVTAPYGSVLEGRGLFKSSA